MPTESFVESPHGLAQESLKMNIPSSVQVHESSMTAHFLTTFLEKAALQAGEDSRLSCMFCEQTFGDKAELGPHVLTQHPTSFTEPAVLQIDAELRSADERSRNRTVPKENPEVHRCIVCGHVSQDQPELEAHLRKHKDYFTYCCNICGRRFREAWFLKNHMKMHTKTAGKGRGQPAQEPSVLINDVVQEPSSDRVVTTYEMCLVCGFFFPDHQSLAEHSRVHNRESDHSRAVDEAEDIESNEMFLEGLGLQPKRGPQPERSSKWVPQLDPFITYQAWQLATRGKVAVGPITAKENPQEVATDHEDTGSDKEELSNIWPTGPGEKTTREVSPQPAEGPLRRSLMEKNSKEDKDRPTTCEECHRTFRTYHQLVLHSRVHKRDRGGAESPTSSVDGKLPEEGAEEGLEEAVMTDASDGSDRPKVKSKKCSVCGKSFRSSHYLTVHLRTHTGEKPYKCEYCDYAAAQKTSLKYHLERRHREKPQMDLPSRPATESPVSDCDKAESPLSEDSKVWRAEVPSESGPEPVRIKEQYIPKMTVSLTDGVPLKCPVPLNLTRGRKPEYSEAPLNLSLKPHFAVPSPRVPVAVLPCPVCPYKTAYPEVLIMHMNLNHKEKNPGNARNRFISQPKRLTGCPPSLRGKDVEQLPATGRQFPRRTKSPTPRPARPSDGPVISSPQVVRKSLAHVTAPPRSTSDVKKTFNGIFYPEKVFVEKPQKKVAVSETMTTMRGSPFRPVDPAKVRFLLPRGSFPQPPYHEPTSKRLKYSQDPGTEPGSRPPSMEEVIIKGRKILPVSVPQEVRMPVKTSAMAGGREVEWGMNHLHSYQNPELASLYMGSPMHPGHPGFGSPQAGGRSLLYQHFTNMPAFQWGDAPLSPRLQGAPDKTV